MNGNQANPYLKTKIMTASPEQLRLMLYEGAIKFCHQARESLDKQDYESSYNSLMRAQKIVLELSTSLNHQAAPDICDRLSALYSYIYRLIVDANVNHGLKPVDEAIQLLEYEKQTWQLLMQRVTGETGDQLTGAQQTALSSLSQSA